MKTDLYRINEADGAMLKVVDIINKQLPANMKKVNHFMEFDGIVYVPVTFGIVQFNLKSMLLAILFHRRCRCRNKC
jgi:hypothetical protein